LHLQHFEGQGSNRVTRTATVPPPPPPPLDFDFKNPPDKVSWSMANAGEEGWIPNIGDVKVQDSVRRDWSTAFTFITSRNPSKVSAWRLWWPGGDFWVVASMV